MIFEIKVAAIFIMILGIFAWGLYLNRLGKASVKVKVITWIIIILCLSCAFFLDPFPVWSNDRTIHYDKNQNRIGYSTKNGDRESHFDSQGNRQGYSIHSESRTENFTEKWEREGHDRFDINYEKEEEDN